MSNHLEYFPAPTVPVLYVMCQPLMSLILRFVYVSVALIAIANDFGDCAVFTDRKRETCADVTSSTNPLDFVLRAKVSRSDKNQVIVQMIP